MITYNPLHSYKQEEKENVLPFDNQIKTNKLSIKPSQVTNSLSDNSQNSWDRLYAATDYAENLHTQGRFQEAHQAFLKALALPGGRHNAFTLSTYAENLRGLGRFNEAAEAFEKALTFPNPNVLYTVSKYALTLFFQEKHQEAETLFLRAKQLPGAEKNYELNSRYALNLFLHALKITPEDQPHYDELHELAETILNRLIRDQIKALKVDWKKKNINAKLAAIHDPAIRRKMKEAVLINSIFKTSVF